MKLKRHRMNTKTKKVIAREFLIAISVIILSCISFIHSYIHNKSILNIRERYLLENKIIDQKIKANEALFMYKYKEWQHFNKYTRYEYKMNGNNASDLALYYSERTKNYMNSYDYQGYNDEFKKYLSKYGIKNEKEYIEFMNNYALNQKESDALRNVVKYKERLNKLNVEFKNYYNKVSFFTYEDNVEMYYMYLFYISLILFPIRYLILMIMWSIKIVFESK